MRGDVLTVKNAKKSMRLLLAEHREGRKWAIYRDTHDFELVERLLAENRRLRKVIREIKEADDLGPGGGKA